MLIADLGHKSRSEYHKVCKQVMKREGEINRKSDKMAEALSNENVVSFWSEVRHCPIIDDAVGDTAIADVFADKFHELYNWVSFMI